jgi:hypothetical protein
MVIMQLAAYALIFYRDILMSSQKCLKLHNFSTTCGNLLGGQHFHTILCISIFVGCSIFAQHIVHLGSTCWVLNFAQQFVHLGIYWVQMFSPNLSLSLCLINGEKKERKGFCAW